MKRKIIPYNPKLKELARQLRNNSTQSEIRLWNKLKGKQLEGYDFHRQKPIQNYILDFFCHELMLGIELDGYTHTLEEVLIKDIEKEKFLSNIGIKILRFSDQEIMNDMQNVILKIEDYIHTREKEHTPNPSQEGNMPSASQKPQMASSELKSHILIAKTKQELSQYLEKYRTKSIGFVPTMGALHEGHAALVKQSVTENDVTVCSIFVNPTQFNNAADFEKYPISITGDMAILEKCTADILFLPSVDEMYPNGPVLMDIDFGPLEKVMEGAFRPGHFAGVATIVYELFKAVQPTNAYFGEKDFQQLAVIKQLVKKFDLPVQIKPCKTVREEDGLAMSSRNRRLTPQQRTEASFIYINLQEVKTKYGSLPIQEIKNGVEKAFKENPAFKLEYFEIADEELLQPVTVLDKTKQVRAFIVAYMGEIRLIDNIAL